MRPSGRAAPAMPVVLFLLAALSLVPAADAAGAQGASSAAVASAGPAAPAEIEVLRERAAAFWAARVSGDTKGQWELTEPRGRGRLTPADLAASGGAVKYLAYQVEGATVDGYFATVKVRILAQPILPTARQPRRVGPTAALLSDRWVRIHGIWYRSLEQEGEGPQPE